MKKTLTTLTTFLLLLSTIACTPLEQQARNTSAALSGLIVAAQTQYKPTCALPAGETAPAVCSIITRAINANNLLITAGETYCGWNVTSPPTDPTAPCVPVKTATQALTVAISNANTAITELKGVIQ